MFNSKTICIAGKNIIAIKGLEFCLANHSDKEILFLPNRLDDGEDRWQKSFKRYGTMNNVRQVSLEDLFPIEDLIFISLEYADLISTRKFKTDELFNIHFSLLPKYKGMYTSANPLINGEVQSGVTIHRIDDGIDTGDIVDQIAFEVSIEDTARSLYFKYLRHSVYIFIKNADAIINNRYKTRPQPCVDSSYYAKSSINYNNLN